MSWNDRIHRPLAPSMPTLVKSLKLLGTDGWVAFPIRFSILKAIPYSSGIKRASISWLSSSKRFSYKLGLLLCDIVFGEMVLNSGLHIMFCEFLNHNLLNLHRFHMFNEISLLQKNHVVEHWWKPREYALWIWLLWVSNIK